MRTTTILKQMFNRNFYLLLFILVLTTLNLKAQSTGDYRSAATGNWNATGSWQRWNGSSWVAATNYPGQAACSCEVTIRNGQSVTLNVNPPNGISHLVISNGSLIISGSRTLNVSGNMTVNSSGSVNLSQLTLAVGGNVAISGNVSDDNVNGSLTIGGSLTVHGSGVLDLERSVMTVSGNTTINGELRDSHQNGSATFGGNLTVSSTGVVNLEQAAITVNGATTINGTLSDDNNNGSAIFAGTFTVNNGGTFSTGNNSAFTFRNGIVSNGTFNKTGTGAVTFNTNNQSVSGSNAITINGIVTVTGITVTNNSANLNLTSTDNNALAGTGAWVQGVNSVLRIAAASISLTAGDCSANGNTVVFNRNNIQTIPSITFRNLEVTNGNTKTLGGNVAVNGNFTISSGTSFNPASYNFSVSGNTAIAGTFSDNNAAGTSTLQAVNLSGGSMNGSADGVVVINGNLTIPTADGTIGRVALTVNGTTTIAASRTLTLNSNNGTKTFAGVTSNGTWTSTAVNTAANLVFRNGITNNNAAVAFNAGAATFSTNNQNLSGAGSFTFANPVVISGAITLTNNCSHASGFTFSNTVNGTVAGSTLANAANRVMYYQPNTNTQPMNTGTLNMAAAGNTFYYSRNNTQDIKAGTYHHLIVSGNNAKTLGGNVTVNGDFTISSGSFNPAAHSFTVSGNTVITGTFADDSNNGTSTLQNVNLSGGTINGTANAVVTINGNLTLPSANGTIGNVTLTVNGTTTITANRTLTLNSNNGTKTFAGVTSNGTWTSTSVNTAARLVFRNGIVNNNAAVAFNAGAATFSTNNQNLSGAGSFTFANPVEISGAITLTNNCSHASGVTFNNTVNGTVAGSTLANAADRAIYYQPNANTQPMNTGTLNMTAAGNTFYYSRNGTQDIKSATYHNLIIAGNNTKTLSGNTTVNGNLTIAGSTTLACVTFQITGNAGGTFTMENGSTLTLGATNNAANVLFPTNFIKSNIHLNSGSTVIYQNNNAQTVSSVPDYGNLTIATGNTKTITGNLSVSGNLTVSAGTLDLGTTATSLSVVGAASVNGTLSFNGTTVKTVSIEGNLSGSGTINMSGGSLNHTLNLGGATNAINTFTTAAAESTVNYNRAGNQTVFTSANYRNLNLSESGVKTLAGNTTVNNNLTIGANTTLQVNSRTFTVNGSAIIDGEFNDNNNTGTNTFVGTVTVNNGGVFSTSNNSPFVFRGGIVNNGTFNKTGTGTVTFNTNNQSISGIGNITSNGTITVTGVTVTNNSSNLSFTNTANGSLAGNGTWIQGAGSVLNYSGGTITISNIDFSTNANTVNYNRGGNQTIRNTTYSSLSTNTSGTKTLGGNIIISENLIIGASTILDVSGSNYSINIAGNWNNAGTFAARSGTVTFNGSLPQSISPNTSNFYNTVFNNTSGGTAAIVLNDNVTVGNQCTMTNGIIATGSNRLIISSSNAANLSGFSSASYVNGNLRRHIANNTSTYAFPVGNELYYRADIKNNNLNGVTYIDARYGLLERHNDLDMNVNDGVTLDYISIVSNMWTIDPNNAPSSGSYDIYLYTDNISGLNNNEFAVVKRPTGSPDGSSWATGGGTINAPNGDGRKVADGYALRMGLTAFSEFGIGSTEGGNPLPIQLVSFTAKLNKNKSVDLTWVTAAEINNDFFTIERSVDGIDFEEILFVEGAGNSSSIIAYTATDEKPLMGVSYYRLKQTDYDGTYDYSEIVSVNNNKAETTVSADKSWKVFPNPVKAGSTVFIDTENFDAGVTVVIYEAATGKEVIAVVVEDKHDAISLGENLKAGIYLMKIIEGETSVTKRIVLQ